MSIRALRILLASFFLFGIVFASGSRVFAGQPARKIPDRAKPTQIRQILALFKSSEKCTAQDNNVRLYLEKQLQDLGYRVEYRDVAEGLPADSQMERFSAIVTWHRTAIMPEPMTYVRWLARQLDAGRKVIVIGNFGAHSPDGKTWLTNEDMNTRLPLPANRTFLKLSKRRRL